MRAIITGIATAQRSVRNSLRLKGSLFSTDLSTNSVEYFELNLIFPRLLVICEIDVDFIGVASIEWL